MAWIDIPYNKITFDVFTGSTPGATVTVKKPDLLLCRYKALAADTLGLDFRIGKAFFKPTTAAITGITMELSIPPYTSVYFPPLGAPNSFMDQGQSYSNDCIIAIDPGSISHVPGCVAVLNEVSKKIVLLIRNVSGTNLNASTAGVVGFFGQVVFEVEAKG